MGLITKAVEFVISKLKRDSNYRFKTVYTNRQLSYVLFYRLMQIIRGIPIRLLIKSYNGLLFCGRSVVVENAYLLKSGPNLILDDFAQLNALSENGITFGRNVTIGKAAIITCTGVIANRGVGIDIGDNSAVGAQSFLGGQGGIRVGNDVIMGPGVRIFSENHNFDDISVPIRLQGENRKGVTIEDDCWIGSGVTILDGVTVGTGSLIAAGSVVTKTIPPFSIACGVPAKVIKSRLPI